MEFSNTIKENEDINKDLIIKEWNKSMNENRIYNDKVKINKINTRKFYDKRAGKLLGKDGERIFECPYTSVLLGDQNQEYAAQWNIFERDYILPKLNITECCNVLDIGCGMGRWAEHVAPLCNTYCGVDFSSEMIHAAEKRNYVRKDHLVFMNYSLQEFLENKAEEFTGRFNRLIIAGVCMYINDDELSECLEKLLGMFSRGSIFYIVETVGVQQRLTLKEFYSETLGSSYDAIYRTPDEYMEIFSMIEHNGYKVAESGFLPKLNDEEAFSETDRWYTIFQKETI